MQRGITKAVGYTQRRQRIQDAVRDSAAQGRARKASTSHLFRYSRRPTMASRQPVSLASLNHVIDLDSSARILDVEGSATYEAIVRHTLPYGLLPTVTPELKGITVGGAIAGIGIESSCFRHGFVHDGLSEAEVLLPSGAVVTCTAENAHRDLFAALPNSYGTLGYVLRAKIALMDAEPYVRVTSTRCGSVGEFLHVMLGSTRRESAHFVDGLIYSERELYVICGQFAPAASQVADIYGEEPYYKLPRKHGEFFLNTDDYIFRYDPDWFWNVPEGGLYSLFRKTAPRRLRHSEFYRRYSECMTALRLMTMNENADEEQLIQDWEVPWNSAQEFTQYALDNVDLGGKPWAAVPICTRRWASLYPVKPNRLYLNLGCYCWTRKPATKEPFYYTKLLDARCFELGGIKMLYSSTFLTEEQFKTIYSGGLYQNLKAVYDPERRAPTLFEKVSSCV